MIDQRAWEQSGLGQGWPQALGFRLGQTSG
jgi:hypothetical protein